MNQTPCNSVRQAVMWKKIRPSVTPWAMGFTLLEMLLVVALMAIVAIGMSTVFITDTSWKNNQETEQRWQAIHAAILGETNLHLNNEPYVHGFVADMGRLPTNLNELVSLGTQPPWSTITLNSVDSNVISGQLSGGWRGPYLYTAGRTVYRDAWENIDTNTRADGGSIDDDAINFGWHVTLTGTSPDFTDMSVVSLGGDNAIGGSEPESLDFPSTGNIVNANDWMIPANSQFNIVFNKPCSSCPTEVLTLRIFFYESTTIEDETSADTFNVASTDSSPSTRSVSISNTLPSGRFAAVVWCTVSQAVYDGDCHSGNSKEPYYFTMTAKSAWPMTIPWNIE